MKKISIIIPAYNSEKYIERCIDSVLAQSGAELDVIAVDDGSADGTRDKLLKYEGRITVKSIKNSGAANARNVGLSLAEGDFVMFLDSDDYLRKGAIEYLVGVQSAHDADIVHFRYECVHKDGSTFVPLCQVSERTFIEKSGFTDRVYPMFFKGIYLNSVCMSMYKRNVIDGMRFRTDMTTAEDAVFSLGAFSRAKNVQFVPDIIYEYYQSDEGLTGHGISVARKYHDNFIFAAETAKRLKEWDMNSPLNYFKVFVRPIRVTVDKLKRIQKNNAGRN